ncbi:MAG: ChbG/HpnK family deacetylase, partial [bacterium]|nr:ChbG/HpnK family deacetylase [bacterium]
LGLRIDHLDSHHHTHMVGKLFANAAKLAQELGLPLRTRHLMREHLRKVGVRSPEDMLESYFGADRISREALFASLEHAQGDMIEVMCHPGYVDDVLRGRSGYLEERESELQVLGDPQLAHELEVRGYTMAGYEVLS